MNVLKFKNGDLAVVQAFLSSAKLSGKASRGRSKLIKLLTAKEQEFQEDLDEVRKPYIILDDQGNPITKNGTVKFKDDDAKEKATEAIIPLFDEEAVIDVTEYQVKLKTLCEALTDYPHELEGQSASGYDVLLDQLEKLQEDA